MAFGARSSFFFFFSTFPNNSPADRALRKDNSTAGEFIKFNNEENSLCGGPSDREEDYEILRARSKYAREIELKNIPIENRWGSGGGVCARTRLKIIPEST